MKLDKLGVWAAVDSKTAKDAAAFAQRLERLGFGALWIAESFGKEALASSSWLLAQTNELVVGTMIASIYARDPLAAACGQITLNEQSGGRFLFGLGVSHAPMIEARGHTYGKPVATMRKYLQEMKSAQSYAPAPPETPKTLIAALGPKMLELARDEADGALPYNGTPEHTAQAREILGPGKLLCVEQAVILEKDRDAAFRRGKAFLKHYTERPNYANNWLRLGFTEADLADGGSDRLFDAIIAWGDEKAVMERVEQHWAAGADHVCIQAIGDYGAGKYIDDEAFERLAPRG
jgi:probable F420-dependent oxidoreductase